MAQQNPSAIAAERLAKADREDRAERDEAITRELEATARPADALAQASKDER